MAASMMRAQSALEYLMTYGWAILIIGVVLGALFSLNIFNAGGLVTACITIPGYECQQPILNTGGLLTFTLGQSTGTTFYNAQMACASTSNTLGLPSNVMAFNSLSATGAPYNSLIYGNTIYSGTTVPISSWPCYSGGLPPTGTSPIGTVYSGYIWLNYTLNSSPPSNTNNPYYSVKIATLAVKVS